MKQIESFFWGIVAALGALILELVFFIGLSIHGNSIAIPSFSSFFTIPKFIIIAACIEEIMKYIVISKRIELISLEKSYIINSFFVGLGFFGIELMFFMTSGFPLPAKQFLVEIAMIHISTAGILGYLVAIGNPKKISLFLLAVLFTTFFHSTYNLLTLHRDYIQNYAIFALLILLVLINIINFSSISRKLA